MSATNSSDDANCGLYADIKTASQDEKAIYCIGENNVNLLTHRSQTKRLTDLKKGYREEPF